jgi:hypothetical protein
MCRERLWFKVKNEEHKKQILAAFKNEMKINKKIPVYSGDEIVGRIIKLEPYSSYIDFYLEDLIDDSYSKNGSISTIELYSKDNSKGLPLLRIQKVSV